jgi:pimeloyl-ACP methyl ester carboxylesterase
MFRLHKTDLYHRRQFGKSNKRVIFFFCGWMTKYWIYLPLFPIMVACGYRVYVYELDPKHVASSKTSGYVDQLKALKKDVAHILAGLPNSIKAFTFGNSLGSESAFYIMKQLPQISGTVLNTVRGSTVDFLWDLPYGLPFKKSYLKMGYEKARLAKELLPVEVTTDLELVNNRPVLVYYSSADMVIPASNTEILLHAMQEKSLSYKVYKGRHLNHFGISTLNHAMFWRWLAFLRAAEK